MVNHIISKISYDYSPFGDLIASSGNYANENKYRFSTKPYENVSETYYYGFRFYNAKIGRWLSRDPIGERGGKNLYGFIKNNIVNKSDRLGLKDNCGECKKSLKKANKHKEVNKYKNCLKKVSCPYPEIVCKCNKECKKKSKSGKSPGGFINSREIVMCCCCENGSNSKSAVKTKIIHELTHAWQKCEKKKKPNKSRCEDLAEREAEAYKNAGYTKKNAVEGTYNSMSWNNCYDKSMAKKAVNESYKSPKGIPGCN